MLGRAERSSNLKRDLDVRLGAQSGTAQPCSAADDVGCGRALWGLWGDSTYDKAKAEMTDQARRDSLHDSANHKRYAAEGLAVAGVGCAGVAVWLYLRQRGARFEANTARVGRPMLAPTASGIGIVGRF